MTTRGVFQAKEFRRRTEEVDGWRVCLTSYEVRGRHIAKADNVSPGARVARASAESREEAERLALEEARMRLATTRRFPVE